MSPVSKSSAGKRFLDERNRVDHGHLGFDNLFVSAANVLFLEQLLGICNSKKLNLPKEASVPTKEICIDENVKFDSNGFREKINMYFGEYLPENVVDELCSLVKDNSYNKCKYCMMPTESLVLAVVQILLDASKRGDHLKDISVAAPNCGPKISANENPSKKVDDELPKYCTQQRTSAIPHSNSQGCKHVIRGNHISSVDKNIDIADVSNKSSNTSREVSDSLFGSLMKKPVIVLDTPRMTHGQICYSGQFPSVPEYVSKKAKRDCPPIERCYKDKSCMVKDQTVQQMGSPDVQVLGGNNFKDHCVQSVKLTDQVYNKRFLSAIPSHPAIDLTHAHEAEAAESCVGLDSSALRSYAKRFMLIVGPGHRFPISIEDVAYYKIICGLAHSQWSYDKALDFNKTTVTYSSLGESVEPKGKVDNFFIAGVCRKFFYDKHPRHSKKHYFFPHVGGCLLSFSCSYDWETIEKCFVGANSAKKLHLSHKLFFPIFLSKHWFVFVVDMENKLFVFLDSFFSADSNFHEEARTKLITSFKNSWYQHAEGNVNVDVFETVYPPVPKQQNGYDCGIFALKFMELWDKAIDLRDLFEPSDIPNLRVKIALDIYFSNGNCVDKSLVTNLYQQGIDPRLCN